LLARAKKMLGEKAQLELSREVLEKLVCPQCKQQERLFASLAAVPGEKAWCPNCREVRREVITFHQIRGDEDFVDRPLAQIGVPPYDIVIARCGARSIGFELAGDAPRVLGPLHGTDELELE
jgi:hypothetical protein